jgi:hypothetical protein
MIISPLSKNLGPCFFNEERPIFEEPNREFFSATVFSTAMVLRNMFGAKDVRYRNIFDAAFSGGAGGGSPMNFDTNPLAGANNNNQKKVVAPFNRLRYFERCKYFEQRKYFEQHKYFEQRKYFKQRKHFEQHKLGKVRLD